MWEVGLGHDASARGSCQTGRAGGSYAAGLSAACSDCATALQGVHATLGAVLPSSRTGGCNSGCSCHHQKHTRQSPCAQKHRSQRCNEPEKDRSQGEGYTCASGNMWFGSQPATWADTSVREDSSAHAASVLSACKKRERGKQQAIPPRSSFVGAANGTANSMMQRQQLVLTQRHPGTHFANLPTRTCLPPYPGLH